MIFLQYIEPQAEHVQFQRLISGLLVLIFIFTNNLLFIEIFILLNFINLITRVNYSPTTLLFRVLSILLRKQLFSTPVQYAHSYKTTPLASIIEDLMRLVGGICIYYLYFNYYGIAVAMAMFMSVAMLISSFFGFCLSSLVYIAYKVIRKK
ncbi:hypothetical protein [Sulfurimonas sp.]|jgi:hypothetical protein|uniref:hypothetical protein n=1 Tax=Sulfurimonas sp. TaxID=2022749 RepID=UPI0025E6E80D|nr:hypothetical protein [Sulfurimonas sp.]MBT5935850.1 hypothetical protein [Sulfurimonas sp.]